ncbi:MAG: cell division protein FtsZ [Candidatus Kapaibacterium sp.]
MPIDLDTRSTDGAKIRVIGVGGGGGNAINNMIAKGLTGVDFIVANTDTQALEFNLASHKVQLGRETTRGLGAGANPEVGRSSVEESADEISGLLEGSDMIFVTAGMGGGTGTGGAPLIAKIGNEMDALVVAIVTRPFIWEGKKRSRVADEGIRELRQHVDALIVIPNQKLLDIIDKNTSFGDAFKSVDEVLYNATRGIADIISRHGMVNVDFADVKTVMKGMGDALMGIGVATGEHRAIEATQNALNSPLLDGISIAGAQGVLVNITGGSDLTMHEVAEAVSIVESAAGGEANLIHGVVYNETEMDELMVTVVATGFHKEEEDEFDMEQTGARNGKYEEVEIPFYENQVEQHNQRATGKVGKPGKVAFPSEPSDRPVRERELPPIPRGVDQLRVVDRPAYERRETTVRAPYGSARARIERLSGNNKKNNEEQINDKPTFLRKIMD